VHPPVPSAGRFPGDLPWHSTSADAWPPKPSEQHGACLGSLLLLAAYGRDAADLGAGATVLADGVGFWRGVAAETAGTFLLGACLAAPAYDAIAQPDDRDEQAAKHGNAELRQPRDALT
jgi:hypothetical protein